MQPHKARIFMRYVGPLLILSFVVLLAQVDNVHGGQVRLGSLTGKYIFSGVGVGGDYPSAVAMYMRFDGTGNITSGGGFWNLPNLLSPTPETDRVIVPVENISGTYTVKGNGTGTTSALITAGGVDYGPFDMHFLITDRKIRTTTDLALELFMCLDTLDPFTNSLGAFYGKRW